MADGQDPAARTGRGEEPVAILEGGGHGLLEEDVLARGERGHPDLRVQVIRERQTYEDLIRGMR